VAQHGSAVLISRVLQVVLSGVGGLLLPFCMSPGDLGVLLIALSALSAAAVLGQFGLLTSIPALVTRAVANEHLAEASSLIVRSLIVCAATASLVTAAFVGILILLPSGEIASGLKDAVPALLVLSPASAMLPVLAEAHRAIRSTLIASFLPLGQAGAISVLAVSAIVQGRAVETNQILTFSAVVVSGSVILGALLLWKAIRKWGISRNSSYADIMRVGLPTLAATSSIYILSTLAIWIVGYFGGATAASHYGLGARIAGLLLLPLAVINLTLVPSMVSDWTTGNKDRLQSALSSSASAATTVALAGLVIVVATGWYLIATLWGDEFVPVYAIAVILGCGQLVHTAGGSSGYLLLLLGKQQASMWLTFVAAASTAVGAVAAMRMVGPVGVAAVYALSNVVQTLASALLCRRFFGLQTWGLRLSNPLLFLRSGH